MGSAATVPVRSVKPRIHLVDGRVDPPRGIAECVDAGTKLVDRAQALDGLVQLAGDRSAALPLRVDRSPKGLGVGARLRDRVRDLVEPRAETADPVGEIRGLERLRQLGDLLRQRRDLGTHVIERGVVVGGRSEPVDPRTELTGDAGEVLLELVVRDAGGHLTELPDVVGDGAEGDAEGVELVAGRHLRVAMLEPGERGPQTLDRLVGSVVRRALDSCEQSVDGRLEALLELVDTLGGRAGDPRLELLEGGSDVRDVGGDASRRNGAPARRAGSRTSLRARGALRRAPTRWLRSSSH